MSTISSPFEIQLFGIPCLLIKGHVVDNLRRKNCALIYYIAAQGGQATREKLLTFFWPDYERSAAQRILRTMLYEVRKSLGDIFQADDRVIVLPHDTFIDIHVFSTMLNSPTSDLPKTGGGP